MIALGLSVTLEQAGAQALDPQGLAEKYPPRAADLEPTPGWAPEFRREIVVPERRRVPLRVDWADNDISEGVVTFGVPFARGALKDVGDLRIVDADGQPLPAELRVTARWEGPEGPVRWALVHARLRRGRDYYVEYGTDVTAASVKGIELTETDERIVIDTGPMRATVSRHEPTVLESVALDKDGDGRFAGAEEIVSADQGGKELPVVVDGAGNSYVARGAGQGLEVEVVESGPIRAAVRREGWYADADGKRFCKFVTYTYFYAGQAGIRHDHTLIVAFDTNKHRIRDIMLPVPLDLKGEAEAVFACDGSPGGAPVELAAAGGPHRLVQMKHDHWEILGGAPLKSGSRAGGWFGLADDRRGAFAGLRDFWQQYPAELEAADNVLRLHLWPAHGTDVLDFRPSAVMGDDYPGDHNFHGGLYSEGLDEMTQAYGLGKTHNVYVNFFAAAGRTEAWHRTRAQTVRPVLALPDPEYVCSTEAFFGRMHPYDPDRFPEIEGLIDSVVETYYRQREENEQYGWIDFGDVYNTGRLWRRWASMFYGWPNVMPRLYLRSGQRRTWDFHRVNTRHVTDIDICHLASDEFGQVGRVSLNKEKGRRYGGNGGIVHYGADQYDIGCDHHLEFMLMDYYLNGNLRTWEVADDYLQAHADARGEDTPMVRYKHRHTGGALRLFSEAYWATWNPEYLSVMRQCADILYKAQERYGVTRHDDVYMNPAKILYYQLTGEERMRELFLHDMTVLSRQRNLYGSTSGGRGATLSGLAHAYWFTGDETYLPFFAWQLNLVKENGIEGLRGNYVARFATHGYQLPQAMALLADVDKLPEAKGPAIPETTRCPLALKTNWAYYLREDQDADFSAALELDPYRGYGKSFYNRREWLDRLQAAERPALRVLDPDGEQIKRIELTPDNTADPIELTVPADGKTGTYVLVPSNLVAPLSLRLVDTTLDKRVVHAGDNWIAPVAARYYRRLEGVQPRSFFFVVPAGTGKFRVELKSGMLRSAMEFGVRNAEDDILVDWRWQAGSNPRQDWQVAELDAGRPEEDETWSVTCGFQAAGETYLRFNGVPGYVASSPEELFTPDPALRRELPAVDVPAGDRAIRYVDADLPWDGRAAYLAEEVVVQAPDGDELLNRERGTVEMWVRTADEHSDLFNRTLLRCGRFSLLRRINIGTYALIGDTRFHRFFALPNDRWTHLAFTWRPSDEKDADLQIALFADGVEVKDHDIGGSGTPHKKVAADWPGQRMVIPAGVYVGGLRVSDVVRYEENFARPRSPFERDEHTRLLCPFDGDGEAWILGEKVPLP